MQHPVETSGDFLYLNTQEERINGAASTKTFACSGIAPGSRATLPLRLAALHRPTFLRVADDPTGGTGKRYVTDELVTQSIYRLTATYG
jgi:hypothetical protein